MKTIIAVLKKELRRFFTDSRMLVGIFLPGILIYVIYSLMGGVMTDMMEQEITDYTIYVENEPTNHILSTMFDVENWNIEKNPDSSLTKEEIIAKVSDGEIDLYIIYDENFIEKMLNYDATSGAVAPHVAIYHNSTIDSSSSLYNHVTMCLDVYESSLTNKFNVNDASLNIQFDLATEEDFSVKIIGMILPFILITFLFSGAMGICSESIAGEKERGTIATLLVTPIKRRDLVIGKVGALGITTMASAFVSFIGLILSIPKLAGTDFSFSAYGFGPLVMLFFIVIITALLFTTFLTIISTYAKSVKEASGLAVPLMMVVMLSGMTGMMSSGANSNLVMYLIPIYNSIQSLTGILNQSFDIWAVIITIVSNTIYISLGVYLLTKMFNSEKVMFNK